MDRGPELYVNSSFDLDTMDVAAFEPLVGCHGGLGGWQDRGFVLAPSTCSPRPTRSWAATSCTSTSWASSRRWGTGPSCRGAPRDVTRE